MYEVADPGPMARLETIKADSKSPAEIFYRVCEGETLKEIAAAWQLPKGPFQEWYMGEHAALYDAALKCRADDLAHEALSDANAASDRDSAAAAKVKADTKLKVAGKWDRRRYGDETDVVRTAPVVIQIANLRGAALEVKAPAALPETDPVPTLPEAA